jgi:hypothetical protein
MVVPTQATDPLFRSFGLTGFFGGRRFLATYSDFSKAFPGCLRLPDNLQIDASETCDPNRYSRNSCLRARWIALCSQPYLGGSMPKQ